MSKAYILRRFVFRFYDMTAGIVNVDFHNNVVFDKLGLVIVVPTKRDSYVVFCLQLLSKTLTCTLHLS